MKKLLIIDDHPPLLECLLYALGDDFEIQVTESAKKALQMIYEFKPDIVLVDNKMPEMSGLEFLSRIRDYPYPLKRVMYSTYFTYDDINEAQKLSVEVFVEKPFKLEDMKSKLHGECRKQDKG